MNRWGSYWVAVLFIGMALPGCHKKADQASISMNEQILPIFTRSCAVCHRRADGLEEAVANGAYFETAEDILGKVGTAIIPQKPEESLLLRVLNQSQPVGSRLMTMPPPGSEVPAWSEAELALFARWILEGAKPFEKK